MLAGAHLMTKSHSLALHFRFRNGNTGPSGARLDHDVRLQQHRQAHLLEANPFTAITRYTRCSMNECGLYMCDRSGGSEASREPPGSVWPEAEGLGSSLSDLLKTWPTNERVQVAIIMMEQASLAKQTRARRLAWRRKAQRTTEWQPNGGHLNQPLRSDHQ